MKKMLSILGSLSLASTAASSVAACSPSGDSIGIVLSTLSNPYFSTMQDATKAYAADLNYTFNFYDSQDSADNESTNVDNAITKGDLGIILNPVNAENSANGKKVTDANIPLITVDRELNDKTGAASFVTDNREESKKMFDAVLTAWQAQDGNADAKPNVYVLRGQSGADASNKRYQGFVTDNADKITIISPSESNFQDWDRGKAKTHIDQNYTKIIDGGVDIIFCENDEMAMGALDALQSTSSGAWLSGGGLLVGFDGNTDAKTSIAKYNTDSKNMFMTVEQNPTQMIKDAIDAMIKLIEASGDAAKTYTNPTSVSAVLIKPTE